MENLKIVARFVTTPEKKEEVIASILLCAKSSREEEGNVYYNLTENTADPNVLVILEEWKSQEAIDFHNTTAHFKTLVSSVSGKAEITIDVLKDIKG